MIKCQCCKKEEASWSWQPFGPGEDTGTSFVLPGNHYRGFPVIKVCSACKDAFISGSSEVSFLYKKMRYVGKDHKVEEKIYANWTDAQAAMDRGETVQVEVEPFQVDPHLLQLAQDFQDRERLAMWQEVITR